MPHSKKSNPIDNSHSDFNASGSHRWLEKCPGSVLFTRGMTSEDSRASIQGSAAHELAAQSLLHKICPTKLRVKKYISEQKYVELIDDEMRTHVKAFYEFVLPFFDKGEVFIETKFDLSWINPKVLLPYEKVKQLNGALPDGMFSMYGTGDVVVVEPWGDIHVIDLKYGYEKVEANENSQLAYYGLGAAKQVDWDFGNAHLHIYQPRREHFPSWSLRASELMKWVNKFAKGVERARRKDAPLRAGEWCKYCAGLATCPAARDAVEQQTTADFDDDDTERAIALKPQTLSPAQVANVLDKASMIRDWVDAIESQAYHMLERGLEVPGYKLVAKRGSRVWKDRDALSDKFSGMGRTDLFTDPELKSPAQAEKILGKKWVAKHSVSVSSGSTIAKVSDKRNEVMSKLQKDFEDWENG